MTNNNLTEPEEDATSMIHTGAQTPSAHSMTLLSQLLLTSPDDGSTNSPLRAEMKSDVHNLDRTMFDNLVELASANHVVVRGLEAFLDLLREEEDGLRAEWARNALITERARIANALQFLQEICRVFERQQFDVVVIKSLDHWPDLGNDLDMYTGVDWAEVIALMKKNFQAQTGPRSWGDRLAGKWNFYIPGLPEAVEIHMSRLGQTGEQAMFAARLTARARNIVLNGVTFRVPSASDRLIISTLQRMYRHFYFRLCDIVDSTELSESGEIDFNDLYASASQAGIWEGVATYLVIVSDYVKKYRGTGLALPQIVTESARFDGGEIYFAREFLRVPIMPQSARLYASQLAGLVKKRELQNCARLSLLPCLATAAFVGQRITGSDKGIW